MDYRDDDNDPLYGFHKARRRRAKAVAVRNKNNGDFVFAVAAMVTLSFIIGFLLGGAR